jgi:para-nitrobenzyl esterase
MNETIASAVARSVSGMLCVGVVSAVAVFTGAAPTGAAAQAQTQARADVVRTVEGDVRGILKSGVSEFLGVPFAAPPVGDLRWRPPQDVAHWKEPLAADIFGKTCAQPERGIFTRPSTSEDCLYLNVYTADPLPASDAKRPVMVWFYGGGMFSGESDDYDGSKLARRGGVVVVTLNYRVGAFGFFSHPAINNEGHPAINYGIMDQQAALRWVQRNIAAFGGDAGNVTIFGQSGGGTGVTANLQSPLSKGLFHRAIDQSGIRIEYVSLEARTKAATDFAVAAGCADQSAKCLRALTPEQIIANGAGIVRLVTAFPSPDGTVITYPAAEAFSQGHFNHVPIMTGLVADEQAYFLPETNTGVARTAADFNNYIASFGPQFTESLKSKYPLANYASPSHAEIAMAQGQKSCTARFMEQAWSKYVPVYAYEFQDRTAPSYFRPVSYPMGAFHTAELQYLFPLFHGARGTPHPLNAEQERLSDILVDYWATFAKHGAPNAPDKAHLPEWPRYSADKDNIQAIDLPGQKQRDGYGKIYDCAFWDPIVAMQVTPPKK